MSRSRKAEKRQKRKEKKRQQLEKDLTENKVKFDVLYLLQHEQLDSKPNLGKFLNTYVKDICGCNNGRLQLYPFFKYDVSKLIVHFIDGHTMIFCKNGIKGSEFYFYDDLDEVQLKSKDIESIQQFFEYLQQFKFIP